MNNELSSAAKCFGLYDDNKIIGICAVLHQPHGKCKNIKRCSRLVILPDYQGIGLGKNFLEIVANYYKSQGFRFCIVTSAKNMIMALIKSKKWRLYRQGTNKCSSKKNAIDYGRISMRRNVTTCGFEYISEERGDKS